MIPPDTPRFEVAKFSKPDPFYWPGYMWIWNEKLTTEHTTAQIHDMANHKALTPMVVPEPKAFRPHNMPTRLEPEYLSPEYLSHYHNMVETAAQSHMNVWLYDEGGWPSGSVCGQLVQQYPALANQKLVKKFIWVWKGKTLKIPPNCISAVLYQKKRCKLSLTNKTGKIRQRFQFIRSLTPGTSVTIEIPQAQVRFFFVQKTGRYPDLLNPEATQKFIQMTHETYKKTLASYFGNTISLTFTDEPKIAQKPPWTEGLAQDFAHILGYDLLPHLLSLFEGNSDADMQFRIDFSDWWSQRFASAFFGQIQEWCHANQLLSGGHLNGEDETIGALHHGFGHVLRPFRKMDVPGVDVIWRQIWPMKQNHHYPKYASSVAHQNGKRWVLSESFAVYGAGITPVQMKWILDYQLVRGVTLFDLAVYQYSNRDWFIGGERPVFGEHNPLWQGMATVHSYIARLSYALSCGEPEIQVAIYYPVRDLWANGPSTIAAAASHDLLAKTLLESQCDFDVIDDDLLIAPETQIDSGQLLIGSMKYSIILVSKTQWMSVKAKERLQQFIISGGKVAWNAEIPEILPHIMQIEPHNTQIRVCKRRLSNGNLYFLTYEGLDDVDCVVTFQESLPIIEMDPETANYYPVSKAIKCADGWKVALHFHFGKSYLFCFNNDKFILTAKFDPQNEKTPLIILDQGWMGQKIRSYQIQKQGFHIQDLSSTSAKEPISLGDWQKWAGSEYSGEIKYHIEFNCDQNTVKRAMVLDLGIVKYISDVKLNGESLGTRLWAPYQYFITEKLHVGSNSLSIVVSNTLANQYLSTKWNQLWPRNKLGPYHPKALRFERDSLPSGLFGPVNIYF